MAFNRQSTPQNEEMTTISVRGWQQSKAAANEDGGVQSLKSFLERKAGRPIFGTQIQGDALLISVKTSDEARFTHLNNFTWAGTNIIVQKSSSPPSGPFGRSNNASSGQRNNQQRFNNPQNNQHDRHNRSNNNLPNNNSRRQPLDNVTMGGSPFNQQHTTQPQIQQVNEVEQIMVNVIRKRYNAGQKYLTFESLAADPDFVQAGLSSSAASKVFASLFVCCEKQVFETPTKRREMVESLSLSNNGLTTVKDVIAAASTFANIKNLDLSNNNIPDVGELRYWRNRFRNLEHLILSGNPVALKPETKDTMRRWYPKLKLYNNEAVRVDASQPGVLNPPTPPQPTASPVNLLPTEPHPEFEPGSTFGVAQPGKPEEQLIKEQMGLKFSYETRLKMQYVEMCLTANNFNYDAALADLQNSMSAGNIPAEAFLQV